MHVKYSYLGQDITAVSATKGLMAKWTRAVDLQSIGQLSTFGSHSAHQCCMVQTKVAMKFLEPIAPKATDHTCMGQKSANVCSKANVGPGFGAEHLSQLRPPALMVDMSVGSGRDRCFWVLHKRGLRHVLAYRRKVREDSRSGRSLGRLATIALDVDEKTTP